MPRLARPVAIPMGPVVSTSTEMVAAGPPLDRVPSPVRRLQEEAAAAHAVMMIPLPYSDSENEDGDGDDRSGAVVVVESAQDDDSAAAAAAVAGAPAPAVPALAASSAPASAPPSTTSARDHVRLHVGNPAPPFIASNNALAGVSSLQRDTLARLVPGTPSDALISYITSASVTEVADAFSTRQSEIVNIAFARRRRKLYCTMLVVLLSTIGQLVFVSLLRQKSEDRSSDLTWRAVVFPYQVSCGMMAVAMLAQLCFVVELALALDPGASYVDIILDPESCRNVAEFVRAVASAASLALLADKLEAEDDGEKSLEAIECVYPLQLYAIATMVIFALAGRTSVTSRHPAESGENEDTKQNPKYGLLLSAFFSVVPLLLICQKVDGVTQISWLAVFWPFLALGFAVLFFSCTTCCAVSLIALGSATDRSSPQANNSMRFCLVASFGNSLVLLLFVPYIVFIFYLAAFLEGESDRSLGATIVPLYVHCLATLALAPFVALVLTAESRVRAAQDVSGDLARTDREDHDAALQRVFQEGRDGGFERRAAEHRQPVKMLPKERALPSPVALARLSSTLFADVTVKLSAADTSRLVKAATQGRTPRVGPAAADEWSAPDDDDVTPGTRRQCLVCMDNPADTVFRPCLHSGVCQECAVQLQALRGAGGAVCHLCREPIAQILKIEAVGLKGPAATTAAADTEIVVLAQSSVVAVPEAARERAARTLRELEQGVTGVL